MSWMEYTPFYNYFFLAEGVEEQKITKQSEFLSWLLSFVPSVSTPNNVSYVENVHLVNSKLSFKDSYDHVLDEIVRLHSPDGNQQAIDKLHFNLCLTPFVVTIALLMSFYLGKFAVRYGIKLVLGFSYMIQRVLLGKNKSELELRMDFLESLMIRSAKNQETKVPVDVNDKLTHFIDTNSEMLRSTHTRLINLIQVLDELLQTSVRASSQDEDAKHVLNLEKYTGDAAFSKETKEVVQI